MNALPGKEAARRGRAWSRAVPYILINVLAIMTMLGVNAGQATYSGLWWASAAAAMLGVVSNAIIIAWTCLDSRREAP